MRINLPEYGEDGGYIMFIPKFEQKVISQEPATVELRLAGSDLQEPIITVDVSKNLDYIKEGGMPVSWAEVTAEYYTNWTAETFIVKCLNADGDELKTEIVKSGIVLKISFPDFKTNEGKAGAIRIGIKEKK